MSSDDECFHPLPVYARLRKICFSILALILSQICPEMFLQSFIRIFVWSERITFQWYSCIALSSVKNLIVVCHLLGHCTGRFQWKARYFCNKSLFRISTCRAVHDCQSFVYSFVCGNKKQQVDGTTGAVVPQLSFMVCLVVTFITKLTGSALRCIVQLCCLSLPPSVVVFL